MTDAAAALAAEFGAALGIRAVPVFVGAATLASAYPVSDLAAAAIGVAGAAVADLIADGGSAGAPRVSPVVDRTLADIWFGPALVPENGTPPSVWDPIAGDYATRDGWIRLHTNAPAHRRAALAVLGLDGDPDRDAVERAVAGWSADALETAVIEAGGAAARLRSPEEWAAHPQGSAVAAEPLVHLERLGAGDDSPPAGLPGRPLAGVRVLDLTRVLAGPVATQFLAGLGAEVLRIDPPDWDEPAVLPMVTSGKRRARLDARAHPDALERLLRDADVLVHGLRPGAIEGLGLAPERIDLLRPGLVEVRLDAYGWSGPWAARRGFDSLLQLSTGIAETGRRATGSERPVALPVQALDVATGYLAAATALVGIAGARRDGRGMRARLSLARTAWALEGARHRVDAGEWERAPVSVEPLPEPRRERIDTAWGPQLRAHPPVEVPGAPLRWDLPPGPLGSDPAEWD